MATGHDRCRGYPVAKGDIDIPLGLRDADVMMSALRRLLCYWSRVLIGRLCFLLVWLALDATLGIAGID